MYSSRMHSPAAGVNLALMLLCMLYCNDERHEQSYSLPDVSDRP